MEATPYWKLVREMRDAYNHRLRMVSYARQNGLKAAARFFQTTRRTVRKWVRRHQQDGLKGLVGRSRAPHRQPRKTPAEIEAGVVQLRRRLPTFGARRLIGEFDLPLSHRTLERIWRAHGLIQRRRRKYQRKQDLAAVKATWRLFQQISADTKDLKDIPHFWPQAQRLGLPLIQYTAREVRSGLLFLAFARRRTAGASQLFAERIQRHLARCGIDRRHLVWQTDNGTEFIGGHDDAGQPTGFPAALGPSQHVRIPPAAHTYNSDVETLHRLIEDEFYDLETFASRADFLAKATVYQLYFNLARPNSHKGGLSPWQIVQHLQPQLPLRLCLLSPVYLDRFLDSKGGYLVCRHPYSSLTCRGRGG
jgi:transposase